MDLLERFKLASAISPTQEENPEENYDSPDGSKWIVAIDDQGSVYVLSRPNIHHSFFENGQTAEEIGLPYEVDGAPGVYEWICNINYSYDWESGYIDSWEFDVIEEKLLWTWESNGEADEARDQKTQPDSGSTEL